MQRRNSREVARLSILELLNTHSYLVNDLPSHKTYEVEFGGVEKLMSPDVYSVPTTIFLDFLDTCAIGS